jgi:hypothetical protein
VNGKFADIEDHARSHGVVDIVSRGRIGVGGQVLTGIDGKMEEFTPTVFQ